jgi:hypothetical protein
MVRRPLASFGCGIGREAVPIWGAGYGVTDFAQAAMSGLLAALRVRQDADRSVGKVAAFLVLPQ